VAGASNKFRGALADRLQVVNRVYRGTNRAENLFSFLEGAALFTGLRLCNCDPNVHVLWYVAEMLAGGEAGAVTTPKPTNGVAPRLEGYSRRLMRLAAYGVST
jgi:hypothetical protein